MIKSLAVAIVMGVAAVPATGADAQSADCHANNVDKGSFFSGHTFKTNADVRVDKLAAYKRIYAYLASENWRINSGDKDAGVISASEDMHLSNNGTAPLNVLIGDTVNGVTNIAVTVSVGPGKIASKPEEGLCKIIASAGG